MNIPLILSLRICARTSPCPKSCPRYYVTRDKEECARQLLEAAAHTLHGCVEKPVHCPHCGAIMDKEVT